MLYDQMMDPAFPGMKADSGDDRVESYPVGATPIPFGAVVGTTNKLLGPGPGTKVRGITLHSHCHPTQYVQGDSASVMRRGLVWAKVAPGGAVTEDGPVKYSAAGLVGNAGANDLPNASFRSGLVTRGDGTTVALVELHDPMLVAPVAP